MVPAFRAHFWKCPIKLEKMKKLLIIIGLTVVGNFSYAGGWLKGKDKGFVKLNQSVMNGNQFYNSEGKVVNIITTGVYQTSLYAEYGISKKFDLIGYVPFVSRLTLNSVQFTSGLMQEGDEFTSIGDTDLGLKYGIRQGKSLVISVSLILGLPIGTTSGGNTELLQTGDGEFNQLVQFDFGYSFKKSFYTNVGIGFNNRTNGFSEEFRSSFEIGYEYKKKVIIALKASSVESFENGNAENTGNGIFANNLEFFSYGAEASYRITNKLGVSASYFTAGSGQNVLAVSAYNFGIFWELK
jgi:hypothetical protein